MSKNIEAKKVVVSEIEEKIEKCQSMVVVEYKALTVEQVTALRAKCYGNISGIRYRHDFPVKRKRAGICNYGRI